MIHPIRFLWAVRLLPALLLPAGFLSAQTPPAPLPYAAPEYRDVLAGTATLRILLVTGQSMLAWKGRSEVRVQPLTARTALYCAPADETVGIARETPDRSCALRKAGVNFTPVTGPITLTSTAPIQLWTATPNVWTSYTGPLIVTPLTNGTFSVAREMLLEEYLRNVAPAEMPSTFHPQALRAQAVLARTYTLQELGRHAADGADLCANVHCQVFGADARRTPATDAAVRDTRGIILLYHDKLADAFYHSCCGGITDDAGYIWGPEFYRPYLSGEFDSAEKLPAADVQAILARTSPYCKDAGTLRWSKTYSASDVNALIQKNLPFVTGDGLLRITTVTNLTVESRTPSGRAGTLRVEGDGASVLVFGDQIRWLFGTGIPGPEGLWSTLFTLSITRNAGGTITGYTFSGGGRGHGLGMCQWGAQGRAKAGQSYREILRAYFPNTHISGK